FNASDPYSSTPLVLQSGTTYGATLPAGTCGQTAQFYFAATGSGASTVTQPCNAPTSVFSAPVLNLTAPSVIYNFPMDSNPGWTTTGQWAFGHPTGGCGASDPTNGFTGTNVYGYNLAGCYANNITTPNFLTTTALDCSNLIGTQLKFRRWLRIESALYDH